VGKLKGQALELSREPPEQGLVTLTATRGEVPHLTTRGCMAAVEKGLHAHRLGSVHWDLILTPYACVRVSRERSGHRGK
jgi:hypothetical protein